jgi:hypothetical protein
MPSQTPRFGSSAGAVARNVPRRASARAALATWLALLALGCGGATGRPADTVTSGSGGEGAGGANAGGANAGGANAGGTAGVGTDPDPVRPLVGAIRWDAWVGDLNPVGLEVEATLSPQQYHHRVPFYGEELGVSSIRARCTTQACADEELAHANRAFIDYFAFVGYANGSNLDLGRKLYLSSSQRGRVRFALIKESYSFNALSAAEVVSYFSHASYQRVADGRPLLFVLGSSGLAKADIDALRGASTRAGLPTPYIVLMRTDGDLAAVQRLGFDAVSLYATSWIGSGAPYADLAAADRQQWDYQESQGYEVIPHVMAGWDKRPRHDRPVSWEQDPGPDAWVQMPTDDELAAHLRSALSWVDAHRTSARANSVIVYAWNEFDEGGFICPALAAYGGSQRLDTLGALLSTYRSP